MIDVPVVQVEKTVVLPRAGGRVHRDTAPHNKVHLLAGMDKHTRQVARQNLQPPPPGVFPQICVAIAV